MGSRVAGEFCWVCPQQGLGNPMGWNPMDLGVPEGSCRVGRSGDHGGGLRGPVGWDPVRCKGLSILEGAREILQGLDGMGVPSRVWGPQQWP